MRRRTSVALIGAVFCGVLLGASLWTPKGLNASATRAVAQHASTFVWRENAPWFGGFSALEIAPDGASAIIVSDRGRRLDVDFTREDGRIVKVDIRQRSPLWSKGAKPREPGDFDSEGIAQTPNGLCVSFEMDDRVGCYPRARAPVDILPKPRDFNAFSLNGGLEALAADAQGRLWAIPEDFSDRAGAVPVFLYDGSRWSIPFRLPDRGAFHPVGADIFDGVLYVLERQFVTIGFRSRLVRVDLAGGPVTTLLESHLGVYDNLEGVSVWRDQKGRLIATMISDDNFKRWVQRTEIVEFILPDRLASVQ